MVPVTKLPGVGKARAALLEKLGIYTAEDLLALYPHRYEDRSMVLPIEEVTMHMGENVSIVAAVLEPPRERRIYGGRTMTQVTVGDRTGALTVTFFNNPYIKNKLKEGKLFNFYGKLDPKMLLNMVAPQVEELKPGSKPGVYPIYPLTAGLNQPQLRRWVRAAYEAVQESLTDPLPEKLREKYQLAELRETIAAVHFPADQKAVLWGRRRLIFEELLYFQLGLGLYSTREKAQNHFQIHAPSQDFLKLQPFTPTPSQQQAVAEILQDMQGDFAMNRLLQGDVGSGKTYVAGEAAFAALYSGYQAAIMAPTEILARQHAEYFRPLFEKLGYSTGLLVGSMTQKEKKETYAALEKGEIQLVVGTHALLQEQVQFQNLGLVIADEQHRFGVRQRATLASKGKKPHILVMSATPIPRTMALMVWGDLDLSVLEGLPAGRKQIQTYLVGTGYWNRLQNFMEQQIAEGGQVYIVCPLVEENTESDLKSAEALFAELQQQYGPLADMIHGKMKAAPKDAAMEKFVAGETKILISTTVIEVGINVPAATLMILMNAERFGLSQLHQLRGRVGRGSRQSYCVLVSDHQNEKTRERLEYFCSTTDGFAISEKDLELRGPGDFFGNMQHGLPKMQIADCATDLELLTLSNRCAKRMLQYDPGLTAEYNQGIRQKVQALFENENTIFN
ncbi:MAG: ATP-dependent DNA helicase RecG [Clostridia bacterium]|nr:ATP-dependent DNA helicase RecG [Clostridia bacterium]